MKIIIIENEPGNKIQNRIKINLHAKKYYIEANSGRLYYK